MADDASMENKGLSEAIVAAVKAHWDETGRAALLSNIGTSLTNSNAWNPAEAGIGLRTYVETFLRGRLRIERRPDHETIVGLFPLDATLDQDLSVYFSPMRKPGPPAFKPAIWQAFRTAIPENHVRIVDLRRELAQDRTAPVTQLAASELLVTSSDQPLPQFLGDGRATRQAIERWAAFNKVELADLLVGSVVSGPAPETPSSPARRNLLETLLAALDHKDQQRISMPLDIVDRLRRHQL